MKFAVCNEIFGEQPWADVCRFAKQSGFDGVEVAPFVFAAPVTNVTATQRAEIKRGAQDNRLEILALHMLLPPPSLGFQITSPDAAVRQKTVDYVKALIDFARDVGCPAGARRTRAVARAGGRHAGRRGRLRRGRRPRLITGLRIGIAAIQGCAFAAGRPVVGVSALEALALAAASDRPERHGMRLGVWMARSARRCSPRSTTSAGTGPRRGSTRSKDQRSATPPPPRRGGITGWEEPGAR